MSPTAERRSGGRVDNFAAMLAGTLFAFAALALAPVIARIPAVARYLERR
jgi:hypothetical protein